MRAVWRGWLVTGLFLLWWIGGWSTTLAYRVRSAVLRVGDAGAERVSGDEDAWRQALMHQAPVRIKTHTRLRLEVELEPFSSVPEQAMWVWQVSGDRPAVATPMDPTPSWEVRWIAGERNGSRLVFSGTPERLLSEVARVSVANVSSALVVVGGHDPSEPAMVWRMECSRPDTPIFTVVSGVLGTAAAAAGTAATAVATGACTVSTDVCRDGGAVDAGVSGRHGIQWCAGQTARPGVGGAGGSLAGHSGRGVVVLGVLFLEMEFDADAQGLVVSGTVLMDNQPLAAGAWARPTQRRG
eukprot:ctg_1159.g404